MKRIVALILVLSMSLCTGVCVFAAGGSLDIEYNYWTNKESFQIHYSGHIQFMPAYVCTGKFGTTSKKHVQRAYINYSRDGESVCGGRQYTPKATSKSSTVIYYADASAWDSLNPFASKTKFNYGWTYFK